MSECTCQCKLVPVNDKLIVKKIEKGEKSEGGLYLPDNASEGNVLKGEVIAAGPGAINQFSPNVERLPMPVKEGDMIMFASYSGQTTECGGEEYVILSANDVLCVIKEKEN